MNVNRLVQYRTNNLKGYTVVNIPVVLKLLSIAFIKHNIYYKSLKVNFNLVRGMLHMVPYSTKGSPQNSV